EIDVLAVKIVGIGLVGGAKAAIAAEHGGPTPDASTGRVARCAIVLSASDNDSGGGVAGGTIELGKAKIVIEILPAAGTGGGIGVIGTEDTAVVADVNGTNSDAIVLRHGDDDMLVGMDAPGIAADFDKSGAAIGAAP